MNNDWLELEREDSHRHRSSIRNREGSCTGVFEYRGEYSYF